MKLDKTNVCVFIENEAHLQQARELLERYGEKEWFENEKSMDLTSSINHLICDHIDFDWFLTAEWSNSVSKRTRITLPELEQILKDGYGK